MPADREQTLARFKVLLKAAEHGDLRWVQAWSNLWSDVHHLAEQQDAALQPLLRSALQHPEWFVRQEALELIGFHYDLSDDPALLNQVRVMLLLDPGGDGAVRLAAASVLGVQSCPWDASLICAMTDDPDEDVRQVAFRALLHLLKLGFNVEERLLAEVSCAGRPLTLATLQEFSARFDF